MYPETPNNPTPVDYLDQIAPKRQNNHNLINNKPILIAAIVGIILLILVITISSLSSGGIKPSERLAARLNATSEITDSATSNIKSSQLRALNSDLKLYLSNTIRDIESVLKNSNIDINKLSKKVTEEESVNDVLSRLEDARLNAIYDRTYAREMSYQLETILNLMKQINSSSSNTNTKAFLDTSIENLSPIQEDFANFNQSTS